jgi:hypothetical protein
MGQQLARTGPVNRYETILIKEATEDSIECRNLFCGVFPSSRGWVFGEKFTT